MWWAWVPFKDAPDTDKLRPVVVLGWSPRGAGEDSVVLVLPISSFGDGGQARNGDIFIQEWQAIGLSKPSWVRARRLWGADPQALNSSKGSSGSLEEQTMSAVLTEVAGLFK